MNPIDNIMALHDEAADAKAETTRLEYETWHGRFKRDALHNNADKTRQALRAAIEALAARVPEKRDLLYATVAMQEREAQRVENIVGTLERIKQEKLAMLATAPHPPEAARVPEGWKLVPVEPTQEMQNAAWRCQPDNDALLESLSVSETYRAMLAAAPQPAQQAEWVGLSDEDLSVCDEDGVILARYWETKLREKNEVKK